MQKIDLHEKQLDRAIFQFIYPFAFRHGIEQKMIPYLKDNHFKLFRLDQLEDQDDYYGDFSVSHPEIEDYFLPFSNRILFPHSKSQKGIQRYSKVLNFACQLKTDSITLPFTIHSIDVTLCPYELGFITIRTEVNNTSDLNLSHALEFAARFRLLKPRDHQDKNTKIIYRNINAAVENFVFDFLFKGLPDFFEKKTKQESYFQTYPYFKDEKFYVQSMLVLREDSLIDTVDVYRASGLCGIDQEGKPFVSANNLTYIEEYLQEHGYHRWAPQTYFVFEESVFTCISNGDSSTISEIAGQVYGAFYYSLLLNLFHKTVLLKLAQTYAVLKITKDTEEMEKLIYSINAFTANFFALELVSQSQSEDIFFRMRKTYNIELLYKNAKETLYSLFKYQENVNAKKDSLLLLVLTLYSVVGQMFGMSLVTGDFIGKINWHHVLHYNLVEYFAFFVAMSGIFSSLLLGIIGIRQWITDRRNRAKWVKDTILSTVDEKE